MPVPVYIICADEMIEDKRTNKASLFNVFDRVIVVPSSGGPDAQKLIQIKPGEAVPMIPLSVVLVSTWLKEDADFGVSFDQQLAIISPSRKTFLIDLPQIEMGDDREKRFQRQAVRLESTPPLFEPGLWFFEMRIRKAGKSGEWITQRLPFSVDFKSNPPALPEGDQAANA